MSDQSDRFAIVLELVDYDVAVRMNALRKVVEISPHNVVARCTY